MSLKKISMDADDDFYSGTEYADNDSDYADSVDADYEFVEDDGDDSDDLRRRQVSPLLLDLASR